MTVSDEGKLFIYLLILFYSPIPKQYGKKDNHRPIFHINIGAKFLNKILPNGI